MKTRDLAGVLALAVVVAAPAVARAEPTFDMQLFSDMTFAADTADGSNSAFEVGGVDFFATSNLEERIVLLFESMLEFEDGEPIFELERAYLDYQVAPALVLRAGRFHAPLGYYTTAYHHAKLFQLTVDRPFLHEFEHDSGILPLHTIGAAALGEVETCRGTFGYEVAVGNGRGQSPAEVLSLDDRDERKAVLAQVRFAPTALDGLEVGVAGYLDRIPRGFTDDAGTVLVPERIDELIGSLHVAYLGYPFQVIVEGHAVRHEGVTSGEVTKLVGGFAEAGYSIADYTPYARAELVDRDADDPYFNTVALPGRVVDLRAGLRVSLHERAVARLEVGRELEAEVSNLALQVAFGY